MQSIYNRSMCDTSSRRTRHAASAAFHRHDPSSHHGTANVARPSVTFPTLAPSPLAARHGRKDHARPTQRLALLAVSRVSRRAIHRSGPAASPHARPAGSPTSRRVGRRTRRAASTGIRQGLRARCKDSNSYPRLAHVVRRPRKHCDSIFISTNCVRSARTVVAHPHALAAPAAALGSATADRGSPHTA